ncbi:MAG: phBC6A51 family helix-turn-helix protein [Actinomycetota bacterium]|nr:phBC6A51 family helix-turn-helix protein [Actinomycetota bacterium]
MRQNATEKEPQRLTDKQEEAAALVAEDVKSDEDIALTLGIHRSTLDRWKKLPAFDARVDEILAECRRHVTRKTIARVEKRVEALQDRWNRMQQVIRERAEDGMLADVPGGTTGLIVHNVKGVGKGEDFQLIDLYEVDTGLLAEIRAHEKQAAQELGQWTEKQQVSGDEDKPVVVKVLSGVKVDDLR